MFSFGQKYRMEEVVDFRGNVVLAVGWTGRQTRSRASGGGHGRGRGRGCGCGRQAGSRQTTTVGPRRVS